MDPIQDASSRLQSQPPCTPSGGRLARFLSGPGGIAVFTVLAFAILAAFSGHRFLHQSKAPHFIWQAQAFLNGSLSLVDDPPNLEDWVRLGGRWFVSFPAFPALAMLPGVALFGYAFNDTSFTVIMGALALGAFCLALRRMRSDGDLPTSSARAPWQDFAWAGVMGFGTLFLYCSIRGEVWFTAETLGVGLTALYILAARRAAHPALAGLVYSMATLTRTPLVFSALFFLVEAAFPEGRIDRAAWGDIRRNARPLARKIALFALGALPLALAHMAFNELRFGSVAEFGHSLFWNNRVNADIARWGLFHPHYLARNLHAAFLALPRLTLHPFRLGYDPHGLSLFITTPLFLLLLIPRKGWHTRQTLSLALAAAAIAIPGFFYQNDGYMQFGFRFSLDYTPYLVLILASKAKSFPKALVASLALLGVAANAWGAMVFRGYSGW